MGQRLLPGPSLRVPSGQGTIQNVDETHTSLLLRVADLSDQRGWSEAAFTHRD
jgi:hypothetical protein